MTLAMAYTRQRGALAPAQCPGFLQFSYQFLYEKVARAIHSCSSLLSGAGQKIDRIESQEGIFECHFSNFAATLISEMPQSKHRKF
jgi:hypothetical protein